MSILKVNVFLFCVFVRCIFNLGKRFIWYYIVCWKIEVRFVELRRVVCELFEIYFCKCFFIFGYFYDRRIVLFEFYIFCL